MKKGLGRGLSSLLSENLEQIKKSQELLDVGVIRPNESQPRKHFDKKYISELSESISNHGLIQPIIVNKEDNDIYRIIAGERRFLACKMSGMQKIPVIIKNLSDKEVLEVALIENIQREDLSAIEEAEGFALLVEQYNYTVQDLAHSVGKSRSHVANLLRLNSLPNNVKKMIMEKKLSMGHARCLVGSENATNLAHLILDKDLSVRQVEKLISKKSKPDHTNSNQELMRLSKSLSQKIGIKINVRCLGKSGRLSFYYSNLEELKFILSKFED